MTSTIVYAYLTLTNGSRAGSTHLLEQDSPTRIGRGLDCNVILNDPLSSRVHVKISHREEAWWIEDMGSRNGTFVNGQKAGEARLENGVAFQIGATSFTFHIAPTPPVDTDLAAPPPTQQIKRRTQVESSELSHAMQAVLQHPERAADSLALYQLSLKLLEEDQPDELIRLTLNVLLERSGAVVAGFLWLTDDGQLKPLLVIPDDSADKLQLSQFLTRLVARKGQAVWVADNIGASASDSLAHYTDAICIPVIHEDHTCGVLHLYREQNQFETSDYDLALSVTGILSIALAQARRQSVLKANHDRLVAEHAAFDDLIGESQSMKDLTSKIGRVAAATGVVLICGESGSGKELVARAIHQAGPRSDRPMLTVNCAAIPRDLMESQLFGHKKGAFTGADSDHRGWFQQADTGTLFLDEVGEMTLEGQAKLLRILDGHAFTPVGGIEEITVDVRVLVATNRDLREFVQKEQFREDLYYRLTVFELVVPPLRDRGSDIELLIDYFLDHFKLQHGRPQLSLAPESKKVLMEYGWPGNVRQLRNVIDSAVVLADGPAMEPHDFALHDARGAEPATLRLQDWERKLIVQALERTGGNVPDASGLLGISRATLYRKIDEYEIKRPS